MKFTVDTRHRDFVNSLADQTSAVIPALTLGDKFPVAFEFGKDGEIDESVGDLDTVEVALSSCVTPDRGTFRLFPPGGPITGDTITLPATASWKALAGAIAASWDGVSLSDLCVTGGNGFFRVEFQGSLADTEIDAMTGDGTKLSPRSVVSVNKKTPGGGGNNAVQIISLDSVPLAYADDLTFDDGVFSGILNVDTVAANEAMREAGKGRVSRLLSVRVTDDEGNRTTYAKRPVIVDCTGIPVGPFGAGALAQYLTLAQGDARYLRGTGDASVVVVEDPDTGYPARPDSLYVTFIGPSQPSEQNIYDQWIQTAGFHYWTDFSGMTEDETPPGWTKRWNTNTEYEIANDVADSLNGKSLRMISNAGASTPAAMSWDAAQDDFRDDAEVILRARRATNTVIQVSVVFRGSGDAASANGYFMGPRPTTINQSDPDSGTVRIYKWDDGSLEVLAETPGGVLANEWFWLRARIEGNQLRLKVWMDGDPEPGAWTLEETDDDHQSGWIGITHMHTPVGYIDLVGVATGGGTARKELD